ncbi:glycine zipper 2TM domain-containing protein [Paraurantiacibacter namhicola]|uniref:17 kDa surface antigen n=1 Tax=Paraurantiacibacter namhicola TaxID=645517 RepID=A0A1C7DA39_9SPHN|nr:glycine zipper 2TM domain-containing protein [Paraurantiacibacter namhicola]ANU08359.1 Glycine zipper 2TM domain protein [Paraurantiacibacter namhicola]
MTKLLPAAGLALAASALTLPAAPAMAAELPAAPAAITHVLDQHAPGLEIAEHGRHRKWKRGHRHGGYERYDDRYDDRYDRRGQRYYDEPVYRNTRVWRGNDGRVYCRKSDGTTGLIIGAAAGALLGREIDKNGDRTIGTVLGAAAGAIIGKNLDDGVRCR